MIKKSCETCERGGGGCGLSDCRAPDWSHHFASRAALEARIEALEDVATKLAAEATRSINDVIAKAIEARIERDTSRAQVAARDEEIATLCARADDWAAQYRALSASMESERAGLRHSLSEVEDELEECRKERDEARAAMRVARSDDKREHDRMRNEIGAMLAVIDGNRSSHYGIEANRKFRESVARLRALLGEAKEGGAS